MYLSPVDTKGPISPRLWILEILTPLLGQSLYWTSCHKV